MTILFARGIAGVVFGLVWLLSSNRGSAGNGPAPIATVESPAAKPGAKTNPLQKYIEVSGVRFMEDAKKKTMVEVRGDQPLHGRHQRPGRQRHHLGPHAEIRRRRGGTFTFTTNLAPTESKELNAAAHHQAARFTSCRDWQNVTTDVQITAPASLRSEVAFAGFRGLRPVRIDAQRPLEIRARALRSGPVPPARPRDC